jgi:predicted RNA-binding Zn-ribbon protein involved in translation (DUF1610 family)
MRITITVHGRLLSRAEVRAVRCPECGAAAGARCVGARGQLRESNHAGRLKLAQR